MGHNLNMKWLSSKLSRRLLSSQKSYGTFGRKIDKWLLFLVLGLVGFGLLMVYNSSVIIAVRDFGDQLYYVKEQGKWLLLGLVALTIASRIDYHTWYRWALPMLLGMLILLVAVFLPGLGIRALGAHRWLNFRLFVVQPAELAKLVLVIYLSAWFSTKEKSRFGAFMLLLAMVLGLVILEPDLGTAVIILSIALVLYFLSGGALKHFLLLLPGVVVGFLGLAVAAPYRMARLLTFLHPDIDPQGASYQIRQALLAFGSGGLFGVGIGQSRQKYEYLPEANTDSIFAIIGEEFGFIGSAILMIIFLVFIARAFWISQQAPDRFGRLLGLGIASWIGIQTCLNFGAMVALVPLTGVPLPFISYGGSSLVVMLTGIGILLNISKQRRELYT